MTEADDTSTPMPDRPGRVLDCAARLEILYQIVDEEADDPDEDEAPVDAWCEAEWAAIAALVAAPAHSPEELAAKAEWLARLIAEYRCDSALPDANLPLDRGGDARALAAGAR